MKVISDLNSIARSASKCVATIGNFDGVHLGHQQLLKLLVEKARELQLPSTVISFNPHPLEFFTPDRAPTRLTSTDEKAELIGRLGVDRLVVLQFNREFANTEPEDFLENVLERKLGVEQIIVGDDFRFGKGRRGDFAMLTEFGNQRGIRIDRMESMLVQNERVSSRQIRTCLAKGDLKKAKDLLGRDFSMSGVVERGDGNGAKWNIPTANVFPAYQNVPVSGVFVVEVDGITENPVPGAANIGIRPTVGGQRVVLETHLLDYEGDLYGRMLRIRFIKKLREEQKFPSIDAMLVQIRKDIEESRKYFQNRQA